MVEEKSLTTEAREFWKARDRELLLNREQRQRKELGEQQQQQPQTQHRDLGDIVEMPGTVKEVHTTSTTGGAEEGVQRLGQEEMDIPTSVKNESNRQAFQALDRAHLEPLHEQRLDQVYPMKKEGGEEPSRFTVQHTPPAQSRDAIRSHNEGLREGFQAMDRAHLEPMHEVPQQENFSAGPEAEEEATQKGIEALQAPPPAPPLPPSTLHTRQQLTDTDRQATAAAAPPAPPLPPTSTTAAGGGGGDTSSQIAAAPPIPPAPPLPPPSMTTTTKTAVPPAPPAPPPPPVQAQAPTQMAAPARPAAKALPPPPPPPAAARPTRFADRTAHAGPRRFPGYESTPRPTRRSEVVRQHLTGLRYSWRDTWKRKDLKMTNKMRDSLSALRQHFRDARMEWRAVRAYQ